MFFKSETLLKCFSKFPNFFWRQKFTIFLIHTFNHALIHSFVFVFLCVYWGHVFGAVQCNVFCLSFQLINYFGKVWVDNLALMNWVYLGFLEYSRSISWQWLLLISLCHICGSGTGASKKWTLLRLMVPFLSLLCIPLKSSTASFKKIKKSLFSKLSTR